MNYADSADAANDVDADHIPELGDIEDDSEDDVEETWAAFKSAQEVFKNRMKNAIQDKNFRKCFKNTHLVFKRLAILNQKT